MARYSTSRDGLRERNTLTPTAFFITHPDVTIDASARSGLAAHPARPRTHAGYDLSSLDQKRPERLHKQRAQSARRGRDPRLRGLG
jgi:hypothetical protein